MPGPTPIPPKKVHLDTIGRLIGVTDLSAQITGLGVQARPLFSFRKTSGPAWTVAFVDEIGLVISSHQTQRSFVIDAKTLIDLACEAGVEDERALIIVPGREVPRGA